MLIFWLEDIRQSGWLYGWREKKSDIMIVAGCIPCATPEEDVFNELSRAIQDSAFREDVAVLSFASVSGRGVFESLQASDPWEVPILLQDTTVVVYRRPDARAMRFFTVIPLDLEQEADTPTSDELYEQLDPMFPYQELICGNHDIESVLRKLNVSQEVVKSVEMSLKRVVEIATVPPVAKANPLNALTTTQALPRELALLVAAWDLLKNTSSLAQQLDVRYSELRHLFNHPHKKRLWQPTIDPWATVQYINFYNSIWLILNDFIFGLSCGSFLRQNAEVLGDLINEALQYHGVRRIADNLYWLDHWPMGIKLNTEMSYFISSTLGKLVSTWSSILAYTQPYMSTIIFLAGLSGIGGMTLILSIISDLLALFAVHVTIGYAIMNTVYRNQLYTLYSLFNLFRGKRRNVLRNRLDSWQYDIDQLFLGSILFTLVTFLFPTFAAYYLLFALMRLGVIFVQAGIDLLLAFLNHFPLGALMLRLKDSDRLPGGVYFLPIKSIVGRSNILQLKNQPISLIRIFHKHIRLWAKLGSYYNPLRLVLSLMAGRQLSQIPRSAMRYKRG